MRKAGEVKDQTHLGENRGRGRKLNCDMLLKAGRRGGGVEPQKTREAGSNQGEQKKSLLGECNRGGGEREGRRRGGRGSIREKKKRKKKKKKDDIFW